ncbi:MULTISPECIES: hypothetical protein [Salinibaculum]|uniref:hypothetical protein n=1 Tax=Salinibaculum TaxID=2732368 RepID=UPI0030CE4B06
MRELIKRLALFEAFSLALLSINIWFLAYANGGTLRLAINTYDEMWLEYALWLILTPILVLGAHYILEDS